MALAPVGQPPCKQLQVTVIAEMSAVELALHARRHLVETAPLLCSQNDQLELLRKPVGNEAEPGMMPPQLRMLANQVIPAVIKQ